MLLLEALIYIVGFYFFTGVCLYAYGVVKSWELTGFWNFLISNGYVALFPYPRWLLFWLEWIFNIVRRKKNVE